MKLGDYQTYRTDRPPEAVVSPHGGSLIAVKNSLDSQKLETALPDCCMACNIKLAESEIENCVFYNRPEGSKFRYTKEDFEAIVNGFPKSKQLLICGDVNFPKTNWETLVSSDEFEQEIVDFFEESFLE